MAALEWLTRERVTDSVTWQMTWHLLTRGRILLADLSLTRQISRRYADMADDVVLTCIVYNLQTRVWLVDVAYRRVDFWHGA